MMEETIQTENKKNQKDEEVKDQAIEVSPVKAEDANETKGTMDINSKEDLKGEEVGDQMMDTDKVIAEVKEIKENESSESDKKVISSKELDIGVTEYLGNHSGFFGIIKQRYSDFVVNEVTSGGDIVHLTDKKVPPPPETVTEMPDELPAELTPEVMQELKDLVGVPRPARISPAPPPKKNENGLDVAQENNTHISPHYVKKDEVVINVNGVSKEGRGNIHRAIKALYKSVVSCYKENDDGNKYIVVQKKKGGGSITIPKRNTWPKGSSYTTFVMYKENIDTMDAINLLSQRTGVKPNMFSYAGTKDRRAKTSQLVSVPRVAPRKLVQAAQHYPIHLGNFKFLAKPQKLGQLRGNRFHIVIREVKGDDDVIMSAVESLKSNGFVNYFGSQRFGTTSISTHSIGRALLKSNWQEAIDLILAPRENDNPVLNNCRTVWKNTGNAKAALKSLRRDGGSSIEGKLLSGLKNCNMDLVGALGLIPRNIRVLYLHAYQSFIWNHIVSRRIAKYGLKVLPGDIIRCKDQNVLSEEDEHQQQEEGEEEAEDEENQADPSNGKGSKSGIDMSNFHILSEEEANTTHISQVLLPLPGHQIEYPHNEIKDWYTELLEADGLSIPALKHHVKCYSVIGSYRRMVVLPINMKGSVEYYDDPKAALIMSDLDKLSGSTIDAGKAEGENKAVIIEMTLPASTYATMALRELLKMDTSSAFQATLNTTIPSSSPRKEFNRSDHHYRKDNDWMGNSHRRRDGEFNFNRGRGGGHHGRGSGHHGRGSGHHGRGVGHHGKGRGEKRPWKGPHGKGGKKSKFAH